MNKGTNRVKYVARVPLIVNLSRPFIVGLVKCNICGHYLADA